MVTLVPMRSVTSVRLSTVPSTVTTGASYAFFNLTSPAVAAEPTLWQYPGAVKQPEVSMASSGPVTDSGIAAAHHRVVTIIR